jgi:CxxC motif-containing protein
MGCELTVTVEDGAVTNVTGNTCPRGAKYAKDEVTAPKRMLTSTVAIEGGVLPLLPVVSADVLPKERVLDCAAYILGLGVNIIASRDMDLHQQ